VIGAVASLPSALAATPGDEYTPMCEWVSINPGVTNLPVASITFAPLGTLVRALPTYVMAPPSSTRVPWSMRLPVAVRMVALLMTITCAWSFLVAALSGVFAGRFGRNTSARGSFQLPTTSNLGDRSPDGFCV